MVITPLLASIANAVPVLPPVIAKSLSSESPDTATVITVVPADDPSATFAAWFAVISILTSVTATVNVVDSAELSALVAEIVTVQDWAVS